MDIAQRLVFHHLGVATRSIDKEVEVSALIGYTPSSPRIVDETQGISLVFLEGPGPRLELVEDLPGRNTVAPWIERGVRIYHQAFFVADIEAELDRLLKARAVLVTAPVPAIAFDNRRIAFAMLKNRALVELIEAP